MDTFSTITVNHQQSTLTSILGAIKLLSFIGSALIAAVLVSTNIVGSLKTSFSSNDQAVIASAPLVYTYFPDVGKVASPHLDTSIVSGTTSLPITFLIDSGAKITALPMKYADSTGLNKSIAKRIYLRSATDNTTYGYLSEITLKFNQKNVTIPVVYADVIEPLLGTFGFFDRYTVLFDQGEQVIIKEKV